MLGGGGGGGGGGEVESQRIRMRNAATRKPAKIAADELRHTACDSHQPPATSRQPPAASRQPPATSCCRNESGKDAVSCKLVCNYSFRPIS
jgi:hypothetical protein